MPSPLVDAAWLAAHRSDDDLVIADVRWYLGGQKRGLDEYRSGHIPGAVFVDSDRDLAAPKGSGPGRHPLPKLVDFAETLAHLGIGAGTTVVAYDDAGGAIASRLWWLLRHVGLEGGRLLDGGIQAWLASGQSLTTGDETNPPVAPMELVARPNQVVDKATVDRWRSDPDVLLLDARARERYEGKSEPVDARPGHVPGAVSAPFVENLVSPNGVWKSGDVLERRMGDLGAIRVPKVVCYCGSGVTACHDLVALAIVGRDDAYLYEGSWSDWAADPTLPAET